MRKNTIQLIAVVAVAGMASMAQAAITDELVGNLFHQIGTPMYPPGGTHVGNPQAMSGGDNIGGGNYPYNLNSPVLDGNVSTAWNGGQSQTSTSGLPPKSHFSMMNVGINGGGWQVNPDTSVSFVGTPYAQIGQIRIWSTQYDQDLTNTSFWQKFPDQIKVAYSNNTLGNVGDGYSYNTDTIVGDVATTPAFWGSNATIATVNGNPATAASTTFATYDSSYVNLIGQFTPVTVNGHNTLGYVDLAVNIPAGAQSILLSFGREDGVTGSPGGILINDIQAISVPEPASMVLLGLASTVFLARRRRA